MYPPGPGVRRAGSRGAQDLRATTLSRLASTRTHRRSRSVDALDDADSQRNDAYSILSEIRTGRRKHNR